MSTVANNIHRPIDNNVYNHVSVTIQSILYPKTCVNNVIKEDLTKKEEYEEYEDDPYDYFEEELMFVLE